MTVLMEVSNKDEETKIAIKEYAVKYAAEHFGKTPALRDIANKIGMTYPSISRYLQEMAAEGMVRYDGAVIHTEKIDQLIEGFTPSLFPCPSCGYSFHLKKDKFCGLCGAAL